MSMCKLPKVCLVSTDTSGFTVRVSVWRTLVVFSKDGRCWGITEKEQLLAVVAVGSRVSVAGKVKGGTCFHRGSSWDNSQWSTFQCLGNWASAREPASTC